LRRTLQRVFGASALRRCGSVALTDLNRKHHVLPSAFALDWVHAADDLTTEKRRHGGVRYSVFKTGDKAVVRLHRVRESNPLWPQGGLLSYSPTGIRCSFLFTR
jgi:hypothetical protein